MNKTNPTIRVGVIGATGYTGSELLRLLLAHPHVVLTRVTSRTEAGIQLADYWPNLRGHSDLVFTVPEAKDLAAACEVVFFATPHAVAMKMMPELIELGVKVIDLSADFRLREVSQWEHWYGVKHACPELIASAVYALPETHREQIRDAQLLACPGCYPTSVQLGFLPLLEKGLIETDSLIANSVSGVSGAGKQAKIANLFAEVGDNFKAYGVAGHRHLPEIEQGLNDMAGEAVTLTFVPHLLPMIRGIHSTLYCKPKDFTQDFQGLYEQRFSDEPFIDILPAGQYPETRSVKGTNLCRISVQPIAASSMLAILVVEDNLVKGAAGQAVQIMNIVFDWSETTGLSNIALLP
ncbi:MAG: N-acetyl-gamma-glutamyl-phosphate reductase [Pseudomonadota bacterium]|nr:N-acetyl-gamma-glutamyl-phosphate reductase [Pseudomonadota bacterium]